MTWDRKHLLEIDTFSREDIDELQNLADLLEPFSGINKQIRMPSLHICNNHLLCLWFEPKRENSTRTYGSFQTAMVRLGGTYKTFDELVSSMTKGESIEDTARILSGQCDIVVDRHRDPHHVYRVAQKSQVPVINAGNGSFQHPTQTLLDLHTIKKDSGSVDGKKIAIVGDAKYGRTAHSLMVGLRQYEGIKVLGLVPQGLEMPEEFRSTFYSEEPIDVTRLNEALWDLQPDYIYALRKQEERLPEDQDPTKFSYVINAQTMSKLPKTKLLHPLPRVNEISPELDNDSRSLYFRQADYGVPIRMAITIALLGYMQGVQAVRTAA